MHALVLLLCSCLYHFSLHIISFTYFLKNRVASQLFMLLLRKVYEDVPTIPSGSCVFLRELSCDNSTCIVHVYEVAVDLVIWER